jgi:hypothetical protein
MKKQTPPITITAPTTIPMMLELPMVPPPPAAVVVALVAVWACVAVVGVGVPGAVTPPESGPPPAALAPLDPGEPAADPGEPAAAPDEPFEPEPEPAATAPLAPSSRAHTNATARISTDDRRESLSTGGLSVN